MKEQDGIEVNDLQQVINPVKSRFNKWPPSVNFESLNRDLTLNWYFLMWNSILVTRFRSLNQDFTLNRASLNRDFYWMPNETTLVAYISKWISMWILQISIVNPTTTTTTTTTTTRSLKYLKITGNWILFKIEEEVQQQLLSLVDHVSSV